MKTLTKILICSLCFMLCFSSCTFLKKIKDETVKVASFTKDFVQLVENPTVEKAKDIVHPNSPITPEEITEEIQNNEKLSGLDFSKGVEIEKISEADISYDSSLGGNVYKVNCKVNVGGTILNIDLQLLNTDAGFGVYDYEIK